MERIKVVISNNSEQESVNYTIRKIAEEEYSLFEDFLYEAIFIPEGISAPPRAIIKTPEYPRQKIVFMSDYKLYIQNPEESFILFDDYEIRGYGFSKCSRYLVIASSGELLVLKKVSNEI